MPAFRYRTQEASNDRAVAAKARQQSGVNARVAKRRAEAVSAAAIADANTGQVTFVAVPATATSTGTAGQIAADTSYLYVCVSTNVWRRVAIAVW